MADVVVSALSVPARAWSRVVSYINDTPVQFESQIIARSTAIAVVYLSPIPWTVFASSDEVTLSIDDGEVELIYGAYR